MTTDQPAAHRLSNLAPMAGPQPAARPQPTAAPAQPTAARPQPAAAPAQPTAAPAQPTARPRRAAQPQPAAAPGQPTAGTRRGAVVIALLAAVAAAAAIGTAALLGGDSAPAPAAPGIVPLRVSSGHDVATGFAVADERVVTVAHALDGPVTVGGRRVRVLAIDRSTDLALLSVPGLHAHALDMASATNGEHLRVIRLRAGAPSSLSVHVRRSIVAHVRAAGAAHSVARPALELSASERHGHVAAGDSGAAVVTDSGEVAGIVFAASRNRADTAYAVDAGRLRNLLR